MRDRLVDPSTAEVGRLPDWPDQTFDLIVLSEILYYFEPETVDAIMLTASDRLEPGGHLVACHYRPVVPDHALRGDDVHRRIHAGGWCAVVKHQEADFVLEVFASS